VIALLQRVSQASVRVNTALVAATGPGLLVLLGVEKTDNAHNAQRLAARILHYRVFADANGKMNLSITDVQGELLLVPQFTLAADTNAGTRASFSSAAPPAEGKRLYEQVVDIMRQQAASGAIAKLATGQFGADMAVALVNDGPVTFWLKS
jgi:D-tyrosyl-tRNA(Tyr) deacylase